MGGETAERAEGSREPGAGIAAFALVLAGCYVEAGDGGEVCAGVRGGVVGIAGGVGVGGGAAAAAAADGLGEAAEGFRTAAFG